MEIKNENGTTGDGPGDINKLDQKSVAALKEAFEAGKNLSALRNTIAILKKYLCWGEKKMLVAQWKA